MTTTRLELETFQFETNTPLTEIKGKPIRYSVVLVKTWQYKSLHKLYHTLPSSIQISIPQNSQDFSKPSTWVIFLGANLTNSGPYDINTNALQTEKKGQPTCQYQLVFKKGRMVVLSRHIFSHLRFCHFVGKVYHINK